MYIHTFETSIILTCKDYSAIQNELKEKDPSKWVAEKTGMTYFGLREKGILIKFFYIKKKGYRTHSLTYRISARRVMENDNYVGLFNTKNYDELKDKVNKLLKEKCNLLPKLKHCSLKRLDFCINARLDDQEQVQAYIKIAKRANVPPHLSTCVAYDKKAHHSRPTDDDFTVYSKDYIAISIYNKYQQMVKESGKKTKNGRKITYSERDLKDAENIVRIEIRCMEAKIKSLKQKFHVETIAQFFRKSDEIGDYLFKHYLSAMFSFGRIYTLKEAVQRITYQSDLRKNQIKNMTEFIKYANEKRSIATVVQELKSEKKESTLKSIMKLFKYIDVNYVTVTCRDAKLFPYKYIPTPLELYEEFINKKQ